MDRFRLGEHHDGGVGFKFRVRVRVMVRVKSEG